MERFAIINVTVGKDRSLEGLRVVAPPDREIGHDSWVLGAWFLGNATVYDEDGVTPGRDWLAVVWRSPDGRIGSFGRVRHHREFLGVEDGKVFYTAASADGGDLLEVFDRAAERLSREWGVRPLRALGVDGRRFYDWMRSLPDAAVTIDAFRR